MQFKTKDWFKNIDFSSCYSSVCKDLKNTFGSAKHLALVLKLSQKLTDIVTSILSAAVAQFDVTFIVGWANDKDVTPSCPDISEKCIGKGTYSSGLKCGTG